MEKRKPAKVKPKKKYEAPKIKDLIELTASGRGPFPLAACTPLGGGFVCNPSGVG